MNFSLDSRLRAAAVLDLGPKCQHHGVCHNTRITFVPEEFWQQFDWYSGHVAFPVEGSREEYLKDGKWKGARGSKRREVCVVMLDPVEALLDDFKLCVSILRVIWHGPKDTNLSLIENLGIKNDPFYDLMLKPFEPTGLWVGANHTRQIALAHFLYEDTKRRLDKS